LDDVLLILLKLNILDNAESIFPGFYRVTGDDFCCILLQLKKKFFFFFHLAFRLKLGYILIYGIIRLFIKGFSLSRNRNADYQGQREMKNRGNCCENGFFPVIAVNYRLFRTIVLKQIE